MNHLFSQSLKQATAWLCSTVLLLTTFALPVAADDGCLAATTSRRPATVSAVFRRPKT